jgi:hypothetical protein
MSVREFAAEWLSDYVAPECDKFTHKDYKACCKALVFPHLGETRIDRITPSTIRVFVTRLNEEGGYPSVHRGLRTLSAMLTVAKSWGYILENPALRNKREKRFAE